MKSSQPPGSALLAKGEAFFALGLATMQSVPDYGAEKTKDISDRTRDRDERNGRCWIERFNEVHRLNHVRPENEIENRLCPANQNKKRPSHMPTADQHGDHQPNLIGIGHYSLFVIRRFYLRACGKKLAPGTRSVIDQKRV
jgi:hypothetical protein